MPQAITSSDVQFPANGGTTPGYLSRPRRAGRYPGLIVMQEWWGLDDHIKDVTERFAREGYVALAPDLYHGQVTTEPTEAQKLSQGMDRTRAVREINGAIAYLKGQPSCRGKIGTIGYCMGGGLSIATACQNRDVNACVVYYGANPTPLDLVQHISCPVLGLYAELDQRITGTVPQLKAALERYGKQHETHIYPGTQHAFFNDRHPEVYNAEAAQDAWRRTLAFFRANLG